MPEIEIRAMHPSDLPGLLAIDHDYVSDHVWQMNVQEESGPTPSEYQLRVSFHQQQLPRSVHVAYPRSTISTEEDWQARDEVLVALFGGEVVGYISLMQNIAPLTAWATDLAVVRRHRRQGIGSGLVLAGQAWGHQKGCHRMVLEMQPKNYPAICMVKKLGFDLCGYNDRYYPNRDIALFFAKAIR